MVPDRLGIQFAQILNTLAADEAIVNAAHPRRVPLGLTTAGGQTVAPTAAQARSRFQPLLIAVSSPTSDARFRRVSDYPNVASAFRTSAKVRFVTVSTSVNCDFDIR
jgi:hypothetical protein